MRYLLILVLMAGMLPGQDHPPVPDSCDNQPTAAHPCACEHTGCPPEQAMSNKCATYCKPDHCHCVSSCTT